MAAGQGTRLGAAQPKAFVALAGVSLLEHAVRRALEADEVSHIVVVAPASHLSEAGAIASRSARPADVDVVPGGAERTQSVAAGLAALRPEDGIVLVHDAARSLAPPSLYSRLVHEVRSGHPAVVPGLPVTDTIKQVDARGVVVSTPDRSSLRAVQTPQAFLREVLQHAHATGADATDDAALVEAVGGHVRVVPGEPLAFKITTPDDLALAERHLSDR
ncbi:2-C-methyl-D-erythritol 4-phosphate cytidylyltransferase [Nostocoides sp. HKS02]|uniref:2-C-methyl-D-erythritol 4-phosphate cytidylyltransferase n=1 Tax=Nostocoides sp. HKS02 TaxID=1813880 RepID=UPI001E45F080|nr:2-C-methyl-D-erythritol 4-phosphate cytidylyltransferase [Tetrasphaera sp. HKS02]